MIKIKMLKTLPVSPDGMSRVLFKEGEIKEVNDELAEILVKQIEAATYVPSRQVKMDGPPANKIAGVVAREEEDGGERPIRDKGDEEKEDKRKKKPKRRGKR